MKVLNCATSRREIEESNIGQQLSAAATGHLRDCAKCRDFYESRLKLRQLVANLGTVEAPADFDFRLRARLAAERAGTSPAFSVGNWALGLPSIALATLVLLVGVGFALRVWTSPADNPIVVRTEEPLMKQASPSVDPNASGRTQEVTRSENGKKELLASDVGNGVLVNTTQRSPLSKSVAFVRKSRVATRELSSASAPVIKQVDAIARDASPVFTIEASPQPLNVSLDYAKRGSRTISVPALSFGSEGVLTGEGSSMVRTSTKGVW
jgi:hypothetical protein